MSYDGHNNHNDNGWCVGKYFLEPLTITTKLKKKEEINNNNTTSILWSWSYITWKSILSFKVVVE